MKIIRIVHTCTGHKYNPLGVGRCPKFFLFQMRLPKTSCPLCPHTRSTRPLMPEYMQNEGSDLYTPAEQLSPTYPCRQH